MVAHEFSSLANLNLFLVGKDPTKIVQIWSTGIIFYVVLDETV